MDLKPDKLFSALNQTSETAIKAFEFARESRERAEKIAAMVAAFPITAKGDKGDRGEPGQSVDPVAVNQTLAELVAKIPPARDGRDGKDADQRALESRVDAYAGAVIPKAVKAARTAALAAVPEIVKTELAQAVANIPPAEPGPPRKDGVDGKDGDCACLARAWKGNWNTDTKYSRGDVFGFRGASYVVLRDCRGVLPSVAAQRGKNPYYALLAAAGASAISSVTTPGGGPVTALTMNTARLLGRTTAGTGAVEELTAGSSLSLSAGSINTIQGIRTSDSPSFTGLNLTGSALFTNFATPATPPAGTCLIYGKASDGGVTRMVMLTSTGAELAFFRDQVLTVRNVSGSTIAKGSAVYINGSNGVVSTIALAKADSYATSADIGVALANISNNSFGTVQRAGIFQGVDTSGFTQGDTLWLSATTAGGITNIKPTPPNIPMRVGVAITTNVNGVVDLFIQPYVPQLSDYPLGTGVQTALGVAVGSAGAFVVNGGALGTPSSGNLTNCTFPTLNQNTTGSAATLTTPRAIYGNNFNGSAALDQIIASTYGGTGNGFTKFTGPTTAEKTFTLPNASATILTTNAAVTAAQGGTGFTSYTEGDLLYGNGGGTLSKLAQPGLPGCMLISAAGVPTWETMASQAVTSLTGTANQVTASASVGAVTLSLPQNINSTAKPTFSGIILGSSAGAGAIDAYGSLVGNAGTQTYASFVTELTTAGTNSSAFSVYPIMNYSTGTVALWAGFWIRNGTSTAGTPTVAVGIEVETPLFGTTAYSQRWIGTTGQVRATMDGTGNFVTEATIKTGAPSGSSAQPWKLGGYTAGVVAQAGKVRVEINGVAYDLLTA